MNKEESDFIQRRKEWYEFLTYEKKGVFLKPRSEVVKGGLFFPQIVLGYLESVRHKNNFYEKEIINSIIHEFIKTTKNVDKIGYFDENDWFALFAIFTELQKQKKVSWKMRVFMYWMQKQFFIKNGEKWANNKIGKSIRFEKKISQKSWEDIKGEVLNISKEKWRENISRRADVPPHKEADSIILKSIFGPVSIEGKYSKNTENAQLLKKTTEWVERFAREKKGKLGRVVLAKLEPNSQIYFHRDSEIQLKQMSRYHVVVVSEKEKSAIRSGEDIFFPKEKDVFEIKNKQYHTAYNFSSSERIHIIIDMKE